MTQIYEEELICLQRNVTFCDNEVRDKSPWLFPRIAIASFPGSGNTWTRHLVEQITGFYTGSIYCDKELRNRFKGECTKDKRILGIKTHDWKNPIEMDGYKKAIFILRSPYEAIIAWYKYKRAKGHTNDVEESKFHSEDWFQSIQTESNYWVRLNYAWLKRFTGPMHLIMYNELKSNASLEITKLAEFLERPLSNHDINCIIKNSEGEFHRPHTNQVAALNRYNETDQIHIDKHIENITNVLRLRFPFSNFKIPK
ncbi:hypothetical protein ScPMuIL_010624 [Solemya velum]